MEARTTTILIIGAIIVIIAAISACSTLLFRYKNKDKEIELNIEKNEQAQKNQGKVIETIAALIDNMD